MKKIVIDARIIETSTGRYMQRLVENLHDISTDNPFEYTVLVPTQHVNKWQAILPRFSVIAADQKWYSFAEQWSLQKQLSDLNPDLVHFTMPQQPLLWTRPAVTTIHDTILIRFSNIDTSNQVVYKIKQAIFTQLVRIVIRRSKQIITPTQFVKNDLLSFAGQHYVDKFTVTLEAGEPSNEPPEIMERFVDKRFFFFVGNAFPYKNVGRIIEAFAEFKKNHPEALLLLAGKKEYFYEQLEQYTKDDNISDVHFLGFISDGEKRWALQHAEAFITASLSEGFCIPLLEAMYDHCPVLSSNVSCLPEVAGDAALYFDPTSTKDLHEKMESIYTQPNLRRDLIEKGNQRVLQFSWKKMAQQTLDIYKKAL